MSDSESKMPVFRNDDVLQRALKTWGPQAQINMMFEEMAELQVELCKRLRGRDNVDRISEEIADVMVLLKQMMILFCIPDNEVEQVIDHKIARLAIRLDAWEKRGDE